MHHPEGMMPQDNGMPPQASHQATSLITTGPDGTPLDEASQQSTLSNTSIGELKFFYFSISCHKNCFKCLVKGLKNSPIKTG
jgi:hypothetical protein